jgi:hypothetical protein
VKALVYESKLGPTVVFLPPVKGKVPDSAAIPADEDITGQAYGQMAARGTKASWSQHVAMLEQLPPYFGRWYEIDVPDGSTARYALTLARHQAASEALTPVQSPA